MVDVGTASGRGSGGSDASISLMVWMAASPTTATAAMAKAAAPAKSRQRHLNFVTATVIVAYLVGPTTSTVPAAVRAFSSGRYMSSTVAAGCAKVPGETARTV